jgi:GMP synthase (glutamine-hydrolysing)
VRLAHGDYDRWFARALVGAGVELRVLDLDAGAPLPGGRPDADGVLVTGSPRSVTEHAPWMVRAGTWLRQQADAGVPVLGVCFGHQLLAEAFGGRVARSSRGRELGTVSCELTAAGRADPLFEGIPARFEAQATHEDEVAELPPGATILAANGWSRIQAFAVGGCVRGVQFHPELDPATLGALAAARAPALAAEAEARGEDGEARVRAVLAGIRPAPWGGRILRNFLASLREAATRRPCSSARPA